jgi:flagellar motor protein MotB
MKKITIILLTAILVSPALFAEDLISPYPGADAVPDLYAPFLAPNGFITTTGGAPASALNPAQGGTEQRMVFDAGYLAIPSFDEDQEGYMQSLELGALFPTRYGVFSGAVRYIGGFGNGKQKIAGESYEFSDGFQFSNFPIAPTFSGNFSAAKEIYPGMSLGAGLNFGFGYDWTTALDLGFHYNTGDLGPFENFTWAIAFKNLGKSYFSSPLSLEAGISVDLLRVKGKGGKADPYLLNFKTDLKFPSLFYFSEDYTDRANMILKFGLDMEFAEIINLSISWPGASGLNVRELAESRPGHKADFQAIPAVGIGFNVILPSGGERIAGGRLPSDGDLKIAGAYKPLYNDIAAIGGGVSWYVGVRDTKPPVIEPDYPEPIYFSPNNDGKADALEFPVSITDDKYVVSWKMEIQNEEGDIVRVIENKEQRFDSIDFKEIFRRLFSQKKEIDLPDHLRWDGIRASGNLAPDGKYTFTITATDNSDNTAVTEIYEAYIKNTVPTISINPMTDAQKIFDPKGQGGNSSVTFRHQGSNEDAWETGIWNQDGEKVRTFETMSGEPGPVTWDGKNDEGVILPDGVYSYTISVTDKALNSASATMANIILDAREAGAFLTSSVSGIAPKPNQATNLVDFNIRLMLNDGIEEWKLELTSGGEVLRTFTGTSRVPATQGWNGLDELGQIREGLYTPELTVTYTRGDVIKARATNVLVDVTGPVLTFATTPEFFSPDNDGSEDELFISLSATDASQIATWSVEIREPEPPYLLFRRFEGRGTPASRITWDGRSEKGELVQSATDYPYNFTATDILGNASSTEGKIGVDVLVIRDGDRLKILIPSIVFRPNFADFVGLSQETVDNNTRIIRRIATILNKFRDYRVQVEGHANPTQPVGPQRDREQPELQRISELRARAIVDQLVRNGVARNRLSAVGAGGSSPVVQFEDRDNWWKNRRVEFILIK